ncbi:MAG: transposase, partial [Planctomycetaceae bacterium]|nr:transposase [Planctomycetaceae bacterium]
DSEYERNGTCNLFMMCEPLGGWRHVEVTKRRTRHDWAFCIKKLCDEYFPQAKKLVLIEDNLNTHGGASLSETYSPAEARRLLDRIEFHATPKHGSWLDMAEIELRILNGQCLDRRIDNAEELRQEVAAWEQDRNERGCKIHWTFSMTTARHKMKKTYPSIED